MAGRWLSVAAAAERLGESEKTVRRLVKAHRLTIRRGGVTGRTVLIDAASLAAYERSTTEPARPSLTVVGGRSPRQQHTTRRHPSADAAYEDLWGPLEGGATNGRSAARRGSRTNSGRGS